MKRWILCAGLLMSAAAQAQSVDSFDDIEFWVGSGANQTALVIDWVEGSAVDEALVWGYRWDGVATAEDLLRAVLAADDRLFAKLSAPGPFGIAIFGIGYDSDADGIFGLDDGTVFGPGGVAVTSPSDGALATDPGDVYAEGWFTGFWHNAVSTGNPFAGGTWNSSLVGVSYSVLEDGVWNGLQFTATFDFTNFPQNPVAAPVAIPEAGSWLLMTLGVGATLLRKRIRAGVLSSSALVGFLATSATGVAADPFADHVVSYTPGNPIGIGNPGPYQTDGSQALGSPARDAGFGSQVGVFYAAFLPSDLVVIGPGGELVVRFDEPVKNHPHNPFGIDLLVFGNAFFSRDDQGRAAALAAEPGLLAVSQDGATWFDVPNVFADSLYPTLGYQDTVYNGAGNFGGTILTDFTLPVNPLFDPIGKTEAEINAGYAGSGGGTGIDIGLLGLDYIYFVRVRQPAGDTWSTEIDAFADVAPVPEVSAPALTLLAIGGSYAIVATPRFLGIFVAVIGRRGAVTQPTGHGRRFTVT